MTDSARWSESFIRQTGSLRRKQAPHPQRRPACQVGIEASTTFTKCDGCRGGLPGLGAEGPDDSDRLNS